jgi:hypothetical protein
MKERVYAEFFLDVARAEKTRLPDSIGPFQYLAYDKEQIKQSMEEEVGYRRPKGDELLGHGDCLIHDASGYVFRQLHGASATDVEVAAMRGHGALQLMALVSSTRMTPALFIFQQTARQPRLSRKRLSITARTCIDL